MLGVLIDAAVIAAMYSFVRGIENVTWRDVLPAAVGILVINFLLGMFLAPLIGLLVLIPMAIAIVVILMLMCGFTVPQAAATAGVLLGIKLAISLLLSM